MITTLVRPFGMSALITACSLPHVFAHPHPHLAEHLHQVRVRGMVLLKRIDTALYKQLPNLGSTHTVVSSGDP
jgi:hypothetical protein